MKAELIIPREDNDGGDNSVVIENGIRSMCQIFGGATVYAAQGYWTNDAGRLFVDDVAVIMSAAIEGQGQDALRALALDVLDATDQEAVFMSFGGKAEIIE